MNSKQQCSRSPRKQSKHPFDICWYKKAKVGCLYLAFNANLRNACQYSAWCPMLLWLASWEKNSWWGNTYSNTHKIRIYIYIHIYSKERGETHGNTRSPFLSHAQGLGYRNLWELDLTCPYMPMWQLKVGVDMIPPNATCNLHIPQSFVGWNSIIGSWSLEADQIDHSLELPGRLQVSFSSCCSNWCGQVSNQGIIIHIRIALTKSPQHHQFSLMVILRAIFWENRNIGTRSWCPWDVTANCLPPETHLSPWLKYLSQHPAKVFGYHVELHRLLNWFHPALSQ